MAGFYRTLLIASHTFAERSEAQVLRCAQNEIRTGRFELFHPCRKNAARVGQPFLVARLRTAGPLRQAQGSLSAARFPRDENLYLLMGAGRGFSSRLDFPEEPDEADAAKAQKCDPSKDIDEGPEARLLTNLLIELGLSGDRALCRA